MKIIILDIDGVLNSCQSNYWYRKMLGHSEDNWVEYRASEVKTTYNSYEQQLCPLACGNLRHILEIHEDVRIVISSTWRNGRSVEWFNKYFKSFKIFTEDKVIGKTPSLNKQRGYEIEDWLSKCDLPIENFVILDDDSDMGPYLDTEHFIEIDGKVGFDYRQFEKVDKLFGNFKLKFSEIKEGVPYKMYSKLRNTNFFKDGDKMFYMDKDNVKHDDIFFYPEYEIFAEVTDVLCNSGK